MARFTEVGVRAVVKDVRQFERDLGRMSRSISSVGKTIAKAATKGLIALGAAAAGIGVASLKAAIDFESAFTGVIKTTDRLVDAEGELTELGEQIRQGFRDLAKEIPFAVEELLKIGEIGGQLGIAEESLLEFTKVIAGLGATTNLSTEEAALGFARLTSVMGTAPDQFENVASTVVDLGNRFATTESEILEFSLRLAGIANVSGITESDLLAIGAAMSSVGVKAEVGGTAVQRVLLAMNKAVVNSGDKLELLADVTGTTTEDFAELWRKDAGGAFTEFVNGLSRSGEEAVNVLGVLGIADQRLLRSFLSLAGAGDLLDRAMDTASIAFIENTALATEAGRRYDTTASGLILLKNTVKDVGITIGDSLIPFVRELTASAIPLIEEFGKKVPGFLTNVLIPALREVGVWFGENIPIAIQMASDFWKSILQPVLELVSGFIVGTVIPAIGQLVTWLGSNIPVAMSAVSDFWNSILKPAWEAFKGFIDNSLIPAIGRFNTWLSVNIPIAVDKVKTAWETVLKPAFDAIEVIITDNIIPTLEELVPWFMLNIPKAYQAVANFWTSILEPSWNSLKAFIETTLIPVIETLVEWFDTAIPDAYGVLRDSWDTVLKPALDLIEDALTLVLIPALELLVAWIGVNFEAGMKTLRSAWETIGQPVTDAFKKGIELITAAITGAIEGVKELIAFGEKAAQFISGAAGPQVVFDPGGGGAATRQAGGITRGMQGARLHPNEAIIPLTSQRGEDFLARSILRGIQRVALPTVATAGSTTVNNNITVNPTLSGNQSSGSMFFDVSAALAAARR